MIEKVSIGLKSKLTHELVYFLLTSYIEIKEHDLLGRLESSELYWGKLE